MITIILYIFTGINLLVYLYIIFVMTKKWKISKAHRRLFFMSLFSFLWIVDIIFQGIQLPLGLYKLITYINFALAPLIAAMIVGFAIHFPNNNHKFTFKKELLLYTPLFILTILSFSDLFIKITGYREMKPVKEYFFYIIILITYFVFIAGGTLIRKYIKSSGIIHQQLKYIAIGYLLAATSQLAESVYMNTVDIVPKNLDLFLTDTTFLFSALAVYAILRYRLMDIKVVIRKGVIYSISLIIALTFYTYIALLLKTTIEKYWNLRPGWTAFILVALVALGFPPLKSLVERSINTLFKGKKSIDLAVKEAQEKMANKTDIESLIDLISQEIKKFLDLEEVEILLINRQEKKFVGQEKSLDFSQLMVKYLQEKGEIVVEEEIPHMLEADHEFDHKALKEVENKMSNLNIAVAIPVGKGEELIGLILLGKKKSKEAFTVEDIKFLEKLSGQALFALGNAVLYRDAMERIKRQYNF